MAMPFLQDCSTSDMTKISSSPVMTGRFTAIFWLSAACLVLGHYAYIAQTPDKRPAMGISWSLGSVFFGCGLAALLILMASRRSFRAAAAAHEAG